MALFVPPCWRAMDVKEWAEGLRKALPAEITKLRESRGLSKNEMAARTGLARSFVTDLEQGRTTPSSETLARLGYVLGISPGEILKRAEKQLPAIPRFRKWELPQNGGK